jgi:hypothetical protein
MMEELLHSVNVKKSVHSNVRSSSSSSSSMNKKKVRFSQSNPTIIMIPSRYELVSFFSDLWWNPIELDMFENEAMNEMREFLYRNNCTIAQGVQHLHQLPEFIDTNVMNLGTVEAIHLNDNSREVSRKIISNPFQYSHSNDNVIILTPTPIHAKRKHLSFNHELFVSS